MELRKLFGTLSSLCEESLAGATGYRHDVGAPFLAMKSALMVEEADKSASLVSISYNFTFLLLFDDYDLTVDSSFFQDFPTEWMTCLINEEDS